MRILVTGAAGFIGSHLTDELLNNHYQVIGMDNLSNGKKEHLASALTNYDFEFLEADILNYESCLTACKEVDIVFHLACLGVRHSLHNPFMNHRVNTEGTLNILEAAKARKVKKFFYISTSEVYGDTKAFPIKETDVPYPKTVYGASKLAGEHYSYSYWKAYGLPVTILRIFNNYGPRAHYEGDAGEIIPRSIINLLNDKAPVIFGNGSITRDFYFVKDTATVLTSLIHKPNLTGQTINIGTGQEITLTSLLEKIISRMKKEQITIKYMENRPADVPRLWVDTTKFNNLIQYKSKYSFEEGLNETISFYEELNKDRDLLKEIKTKNWE